MAKLIVHDRSREQAIARMRRALDFFVVEGIHTSIPLHRRILRDPDFVAGRLSTRFMERFLQRQPGERPAGNSGSDLRHRRRRGAAPGAAARGGGRDMAEAGIALDPGAGEAALRSASCFRQVEACCRVLEGSGADLWMDDRADLAALFPVAGVHVGQTDLPPAAVRRVVGTRSGSVSRPTAKSSSSPRTPTRRST